MKLHITNSETIVQTDSVSKVEIGQTKIYGTLKLPEQFKKADSKNIVNKSKIDFHKKHAMCLFK